MGKITLSALIAAAFVAATSLTLAVPAEAGKGYRGGYGGGGRYVQNNYYNRGYRGHHHHGGGGNTVAAGLIGFGVGAIVGSALTPREVYVAPPPPPAYPVYNVGYAPEPWSPDWYSYCYSRYRSFNPNTGTFVGFDGIVRFCR
ncbi:MAG: BA14K family protein [Methyloceanibacter sp.]|uniref:BA14K family protein n=1 Tax=Methyloceanibacter sp. TaxID=1965321 RepID=UPI003D6CDF9C